MHKDELRQDLITLQGEFKMALPDHIRPEAIARVVLTEVSKNPKILQCSKESILRSTMEACQMGLVPNSVQGLAHLIPYGRVCQLIPGYRGLIKLCLQSGLVRAIKTAEVHKNDQFEVNLGSTWRLEHRVDITKQRGDIVAYYAIADLPHGTTDFEVMTKSDGEAFRKRIGKDKSQVWTDHFDEMVKKSCIRKLVKRLPMDGDRVEHQRLTLAADYADDTLSGFKLDGQLNEWVYDSNEKKADAPPKVDASELNDKLGDLTVKKP